MKSSLHLPFVALCGASMLLFACTPPGEGSREGQPLGATLSIMLQKQSSEDALATVHTKATLQLKGAVTQSVDLGDILGELFFVNPASYKPLPAAEGELVAVFTTWWAGEGEEIWITKHADALSIQHRYGSEEGICTAPEVIAEFPLADDALIELADMGVPLESSSLSWCENPLTK